MYSRVNLAESKVAPAAGLTREQVVAHPRTGGDCCLALPSLLNHFMHRACCLPFLVRPFPNTDPIALTPTALPPRPGTVADSIAAESFKELKPFYTELRSYPTGKAQYLRG